MLRFLRFRGAVACLFLTLTPQRPADAQDLLPSAPMIATSTPESFKQPVIQLGPYVHDAPASVQLPGSLYLGVADVDPRGSKSGQIGLGLHLQGDVADRTRLTLAVARGPADLLSLLALVARQGTTVRLELLHPRWQAVAGDFIAPTHALSALAVRADGVSFKYGGRLVAELFAGRPKYLLGGGGHFAHASVGFRVATFTFRVVATDMSRPPPAGARVRAAPEATAESERDIDDLERVTQLLPGDATLRVAGGEIEIDNDRHQLMLRAGVLDAHTAVGGRARGLTTEGRYSLKSAAGTLTAYGRRAPGGLAETHLGGDAASVAGTANLAPRWKVVGRGLWSSTPVPRLPHSVMGANAAAGVQYLHGRVRVTMQAKYNRLSSVGLDRETQTVNVNVTLPWRRLSLHADLDGGRALQNHVRRPYRAVRGRLELFDDAPLSAGLSATYDEVGSGAIRRRFDGDVTVSRGQWMIEGGAGVGSGQLLGTMRHLWANLETRLPGALTLLVAAEHVRWDFTASRYLLFSESLDLGSPWRFTVGIRRPLTVPLPFLRPSRESRGVTP